MLKLARILVALAALVTSAPAFAQKTYVNEELASESTRLEAQVRKEGSALSGRPLDQLRRDGAAALSRSNGAVAAANFAAALAQTPTDPSLWMSYARAKLAIAAKDADNAYVPRGQAITAAYTAFQRASGRTDEAAALALLGETFGVRENWRDALNAYRASLERADTPAVRATYETLRGKYGFRILSYKIDNDLAAPRACFQFSENLAHGRVDFAPFVVVGGAANAAITAEDQQLCVEGLKHGERYHVVLRKGLPSAVGEDLLAAADYDFYVRDRGAQVRFTGKSLVLPRVGQEGIPVVTVNTETVGVMILRFGDRSLLGTIRSDDFLNPVTPTRLKQIADADGAKVWSGTLAVKQDRNQDVVTAFPVLDAVGKLEPGVYVMAAKAGGPLTIKPDDDDYDPLATQWFIVSDLGLTAFSGSDGVHVLVRSLATATPIDGVELRLIAKNNDVLGTQKTPADGHVRFAPGLSRGTGGLAPGLVVAEVNGDYGFLDLAQTPFDLTDRGVKGRAAPAALDALIFAERGVYRSGETAYLTAQLRDAKGVAVVSLPLTLVVKRPDGVEYKRVSVEDQGAGGRAYALALLPGAATGTWRVQAYADPKGTAIGETTFLVDDYVPERLDMVLKAEATTVRTGATVNVASDVRFLYGAPGAGLDISGDVALQVAEEPSFAALKGYSTGIEDEKFETAKADIEAHATTDAQGHALTAVALPDADTPHLLEAVITLRAAEAGGRALERSITLPVAPKAGVLAVKKNFGEDLSEGALASFDVVAVNSDGTRAARRGVSWSLYRVTNDYQWFRIDGRFTFERIKATRRIADGRIDLTSSDPAKIAATVGFGRHRLDIRAEGSDMPVSITFDVGWSGTATADTPDLLDVTLDRQAYAAGDEMKLRINARSAGRATLAIVSDSVRVVRQIDVAAGDNTLALPVSADWGSGAYAVVLSHRPLDRAANRMPGRALGLAWFAIDQATHTLDVAIGGADKIRPRGTVELPIAVKGLGAGEEAFVTVAGVDVGILNLTHYDPPNPSDFFFGQRELSTEIRDLYGLLIDGMQGARGAIRSGGDAAPALAGAKPTQAPLALYSGVVKVGADGIARVSFPIPAFNGTMRVMATAWSKTKVGAASRDIIIRDPVVLQATLPRFLALGDQSRIHLDINNVEGAAGTYLVDVDLRGPLLASASGLRQSVQLAVAGRASLTIPVTASGTGTATIALRMTGPGLDATQDYTLSVPAGNVGSVSPHRAAA